MVTFSELCECVVGQNTEIAHFTLAAFFLSCRSELQLEDTSFLSLLTKLGNLNRPEILSFMFMLMNQKYSVQTPVGKL